MNLIITKTDLKERNYLSAKIIKPENKTENPADDRAALEYAAEILLNLIEKETDTECVIAKNVNIYYPLG